MATNIEYQRGKLLSEGPHWREYLGTDNSTGVFQTITEITDLDESKTEQLLQSLSSIASKNLHHPNLITQLSYSQTNTSITILSEYVIGHNTIASYIKEHGKFEEYTTASFTCQILAGLEYLEKMGLSVGGLSASDVLVGYDGSVKISHYGLPILSGQVKTLTPPGEATPSAKADIWAVGNIVLEMLSGNLSAVSIEGSQVKISEDVLASITDPKALAFVYDCHTMYAFIPQILCYTYTGFIIVYTYTHSDLSDRPTASVFLERSPFCELDKNFKFEDTEFYAKIEAAAKNEESKISA